MVIFLMNLDFGQQKKAKERFFLGGGGGRRGILEAN